MSDNPVLKYYSDLLILQYRMKNRAKKTIQLLANQSYADGFVFDERDAFNLDTAVGAQLDIIGRIVGVPRNIYQLDLSHLYFNMTRYSDTPDVVKGMGRYTDDPYDPEGILFFRFGFQNSAIYALLDFEMRTLIRLKIVLNNSFSSFKQIKELIYQYFDGYIDVVDNKDMTLTYNVSTTLSKLAEAAVVLGLLPKPMGVELDINFVA